jgi:hypothetical protein
VPAYGDETSLREMAEKFNRYWTPGRPKKNPPLRHSSKANGSVLAVLKRHAPQKTTLPVQAAPFFPLVSPHS